MNYKNFFEAEEFCHGSSQRYKHEKKIQNQHGYNNFDYWYYLKCLRNNKRARLLLVAIVVILVLTVFVSLLLFWPYIADLFGFAMDNGGEDLIKNAKSLFN